MSKGVRLNELDDVTQTRVVGMLHEQGLIQDLRAQGRKPVEILDALARQHSARRHKAQEKKPVRVRRHDRPWYAYMLKTWAYMLAYSLFGVGWAFEHLGSLVYSLGERLRRIARSL